MPWQNYPDSALFISASLLKIAPHMSKKANNWEYANAYKTANAIKRIGTPCAPNRALSAAGFLSMLLTSSLGTRAHLAICIAAATK
jgi:hypothetical protein